MTCKFVKYSIFLNPKVSRRKDIINIRAEINEKEMKETVVKINKTNSLFFEKINKIDKPLPDSSRIKKERKIKTTKLEMRGCDRQCRHTKDHKKLL